MPRARNIKPAFFANEELVELPFEVRLLFIGLWTLADRAGRMEDKPKRIKMSIFPGDEVDVDACLSMLQRSGFIRRYKVGEGSYIEVINFTKHQHPHHKEPPSTLPEPGASPRPDGDGCGGAPGAYHPSQRTVDQCQPKTGPRQARGEPQNGPPSEGGRTRLIPDSGFLIPDSTPLRDPPIADRRADDLGFERWWRAYPRKDGKADARKAWAKLRPDDALQATLLEAVERHRRREDWTREGGRFIPHGATWLNARRWEDEGVPDPLAPEQAFDYRRIARYAGFTDEEIAADVDHADRRAHATD